MNQPRTYSDDGIESSEDWRRDALDFDWFDGDAGEHTFSDKIVVARNSKEKCHHCLSLSVPKTLVRVRVEKVDGEIMHYRWCHECCHAAVLDTNACDNNGFNCDHPQYDDSNLPLETRWELREKNRDQGGES